MIHDHRLSVFIAMSDLLVCLLCYVLLAVAPTKAKVDGTKPHEIMEVTIEWSIDPLDIDADVDVHLMPPSKHPVFYGDRQQGACLGLDVDNKGFQDAHNGDVRTHSDKEIISIRCPLAGSYVAAVNLFGYRVNGIAPPVGPLGLKVHCEVVALEPSVHTVLSKDVTLDHIGQTINFGSFDLDGGGAITLTDAPLTPITEIYSHQNAMAAPSTTGGNQGP